MGSLPCREGRLTDTALILLFRFLFILYAEDRGLLPVRNMNYRDYSFRHLRDDAAAVAEGRLAVRAGGAIWWARITGLFDAILIDRRPRPFARLGFASLNEAELRVAVDRLTKALR